MCVCVDEDGGLLFVGVIVVNPFCKVFVCFGNTEVGEDVADL